MVETRIGGLGRETGRLLFQLRMCYHRRLSETEARGKLELQEGNNPDKS
jgi:hypothetical protein